MSSLAIIFPGQGSQSMGMLADLASEHAVVEETYATASNVLGYDLWQLVQQGPEEALNQTDKTQPAILAAGVAVWRIWQSKGGATPAFFAGHSLGEYTALVCASVLSFESAVELVAERGRLMQDAVPAGQGGMAAVLGLDDEAVRQLCTDAANGEVLSAVNYNSPGQVVIAGTANAVGRAIEGAKNAGAKRAIMLPVSVPSHCELMKPAADKLKEKLDNVEFSDSQIPVINNVDVSVGKSADDIRDALVRQLYNPVRWVETIQTMANNGVSTVIECGPGKVLAGLNKRIDRQMNVLPVMDQASLRKALTTTGESN
ncbi:MAG: ACP S-malonyltransferase [Gammaproteobacteria bacterium]